MMIVSSTSIRSILKDFYFIPFTHRTSKARAITDSSLSEFLTNLFSNDF
jgi:hypothetical protein